MRPPAKPPKPSPRPVCTEHRNVLPCPRCNVWNIRLPYLIFWIIGGVAVLELWFFFLWKIPR